MHFFTISKMKWGCISLYRWCFVYRTKKMWCVFLLNQSKKSVISREISCYVPAARHI
uniref:Uncharacterized protein n=1 Tax=Arundo donax TaxID=35708 RepID=A0A0A9FXK2_ARUDO